MPEPALAYNIPKQKNAEDQCFKSDMLGKKFDAQQRDDTDQKIEWYR